MTFTIWIAPHERHEAIEVYRDRLTEEQIETILDAPDEAIIRITLDGEAKVEVLSP